MSLAAMDPSIVSHGSTPARRYTRSALYLLRNDTRSCCRPKCASKLQLLCIWKTSNNNYSNSSQQNERNNSSNSLDMKVSSSSTKHDLHSGADSLHPKNIIDHRSISSSHLMPAFAKRRISGVSQPTPGCTSDPTLSLANEVKGANGKNNDDKKFLSPQRKNVNLNQISRSVQFDNNTSLQSDRERDREHDRDRGRGNRDIELDLNVNSSYSSSSNGRERRIGSGRLLPRDVNSDYRTEKGSSSISTTSASMPFEKELSGHSSVGGSNAQRLSSSNSGANLSSLNQRFDYTRSPTSKDRNIGGNGKNSSDYRPESRYDSRRSYARGDFERDNRGDNSSYVRRFMSDLKNQSSNHGLPGRSGLSVGGGSGLIHNENRRRNHRNDEPEWFSSGPTSQHETIELRGFDEIEDCNSNSSGSAVSENKRHRSSTSQQSTKKGKPINSNVGVHNDTSLNRKPDPKDIAESADQLLFNTFDSDGNKPSSTETTNTPPPYSRENLESGTNNSESKSSNNSGDLASTAVENRADGIKFMTEDDVHDDFNKNTHSSDIAHSNQSEDKSGFNFDAFLNVDPLSNLIMSEQNIGETETVSRFSRWFAKQSECKPSIDSRKSSLTEDNVSGVMSESHLMKNDKGQISSAESTNTNQSNTLMEFLQRGKINASSGNAEIANVGTIPSVEELEARMRKIGEENTFLNREQSANDNESLSNSVNQFFTNSVQHPNQQQQQQKHLILKSERQAISATGLLGAGPQITQPHQQLQINQSHHSSQMGPSQAQDMEAFKKLLEQITPTAISSVKPNTQNNIQPPATPLQIHGMPPPSTPSHFLKNDEFTKFIHQQQIHQRRQHIMPGPQLSPMNQSAPNDMPVVQTMFLAPQQRFEAQLLLQGLSRGEVTQKALGHQLNNPNTSPRTKEVLSAVLRENSRGTSPNVIMSGPQIMSPVLGQSHCAPNTQQSTTIISNLQPTPMNHPSQMSAQQPHTSSGANAGGLPQRIPSPRELQYHTQSIMQNALIKKKLEEQQENFRRRQEIQKQQQQIQHNEINEFGGLVSPSQSQQQHYPQNQKKSTQQQQQIIQSQQQQRHVNSPTPLAFTPTSVLRKMTAEKDSANSFHPNTATAVCAAAMTGTATVSPLVTAPTMISANAGANIANPIKPINSLMMHYQQHQQQSNSSQNQPRMILGVGSHSQQQQQQQNVAVLAGLPLQQQQHPDNSRLNQTFRNTQIKWPGPVVNQVSITKPMGRPILKGSLTQSIPPPATSGVNPVHQQQQSQGVVQPPQMTFASNIEYQQIQQQRATHSQQQQQLPHPQKQQQTPGQPIPPQQPQNILMNQVYQQRAAMQRVQQYQLHQLHQQQQHINMIQNNGNRPVDRLVNNANSNQAGCANIINYQRDGGLSPTSNQLAQWFSPELLAQASAGKLPPLNMNQALSLEEFEKSIQHSSTNLNN